MATIYTRKDSPFIWIKYRNEKGVSVQESTGLRKDMRLDGKRAKELLAQKNLIEIQAGRVINAEFWQAWVPQFIKRRYLGKEKSFKAMVARWRNVESFLNEKLIYCPRQVSYRVALDFIEWRKERGASHNTALHEVKAFSLVISEAVKLGFVHANTITRLGIQKQKAREKPEITKDQEEAIRLELKAVVNGTNEPKWPEWMSTAFELGIHQGCRIRETSVPFKDIDFERQTITFNAKGSKRFTTALHPNLLPILKKLKERGDQVTCELPALPSKWFWMFFKNLGMPGVSFHCTRVTVVTRLARAGVPMSQAMRFVGHASETIHRVYQRLGVDDLSACLTALSGNPQP
jgi:integrase